VPRYPTGCLHVGRGLIHWVVNVARSMGKKNLRHCSVSLHGWAAGRSRSPWQQVPCTDCRFCVWGVLIQAFCIEQIELAKQNSTICHAGVGYRAYYGRSTGFSLNIHLYSIQHSSHVLDSLCFFKSVHKGASPFLRLWCHGLNRPWQSIKNSRSWTQYHFPIVFFYHSNLNLIHRFQKFRLRRDWEAIVIIVRSGRRHSLEKTDFQLAATGFISLWKPIWILKALIVI
jgi:hypothetical protein